MSDDRQRPCPACGTSDGRMMGVKNGFEMLACSACGSVYTSALPTNEEQEDYDEYYTDANLSVPDFIIDRVTEIVRTFASYRTTDRLLDIGFGAGTILDAASREGWDVYGLEVSRPAVDKATAAGYKVVHGMLREARFPDGHFDVVTASEILEHLAEPREELREISRILRPGGLFWATTPSSSGISRRVLGTAWSVMFPPEHMQLYSKKGLRMILKDAGFGHIGMRTYGTNPFEIINHFRSGTTEGSSFDRVGTGCALNEALTSSPARRAVKQAANWSLDLLSLGDSLKIRAEKL